MSWKNQSKCKQKLPLLFLKAERKLSGIGESLLTSLYSFCIISIRTYLPGEMILLDENWIQNLKKLFKLIKKVYSFLRSVFENILAFKTIQMSWVAKLFSHTFAVDILVFKHASHKLHLREHSFFGRGWAIKFLHGQKGGSPYFLQCSRGGGSGLAHAVSWWNNVPINTCDEVEKSRERPPSTFRFQHSLKILCSLLDNHWSSTSYNLVLQKLFKSQMYKNRWQWAVGVYSF